MKAFEKKYNQLAKAYSSVECLERELTEMIEKHLGYGWFITYAAGDGLLLGSPDAYNYRIETYFECIDMPMDEAIKYIEDRPFN